MPASRIETGAGAAEYAPGSQPWKGTTPPLTKRPERNSATANTTRDEKAEFLTAAAIVSKAVLPATSSRTASADSIRIVATADKTMYLKAPSKAFRSCFSAIRIKDATAETSRKTYKENRSVNSTVPFMPVIAISTR
jgi:hypothetical protein